MEDFLNWISTNKAWLFEGIGVDIDIALKSKNKIETSKHFEKAIDKMKMDLETIFHGIFKEDIYD